MSSHQPPTSQSEVAVFALPLCSHRVLEDLMFPFWSSSPFFNGVPAVLSSGIPMFLFSLTQHRSQSTHSTCLSALSIHLRQKDKVLLCMVYQLR